MGWLPSGKVNDPLMLSAFEEAVIVRQLYHNQSGYLFNFYKTYFTIICIIAYRKI